MTLPLLITMGDPNGIGPEIIAKWWLATRPESGWVLGSGQVMAQAWQEAGGQAHELQVVAESQLPAGPLPGLPPAAQGHGLRVIDVSARLTVDADEPLRRGTVQALAGDWAHASICAAVSLILRGAAAGMVTAPLHKAALSAAGVAFPGHTEMLAAYANPGGPPWPVRMMLANEQLRTVLATIHVPLREVPGLLSIEGLLATLKITHEALSRLLGRAPRIAVAGLNPHAGEEGLFGDEEIRVISPAIGRARAQGWDVSGPWPGDTVFMKARHDPPRHPGAFDVVVAMYHDQGLIPVKYMGVEEGVNVTLGLPFVRTSPDHGTAFDIAGQGLADPSSLGAAWRQAQRLLHASSV